MPKTIKEFQLNQSTGEVSVEYSDDSTSKFNAADMVTAQTDPVTGGIEDLVQNAYFDRNNVRPTVAAFGSSSTAYNLLSTGAYSSAGYLSWAHALGKNSWDIYEISGNPGEYGDAQLARFLAKLETWRNNPPKVIVCQLFANDTYLSETYQSQITRWDLALKAAKSIGSIPMIYPGLPRTSFDSTQLALMTKVNQWLQLRAELDSGVMYAEIPNYMSDFSQDNYALKPGVQLADGIHLSTKGASLVGRAIAQQLSAWINSSPRLGAYVGDKWSSDNQNGNLLATCGFLKTATAGIPAGWSWVAASGSIAVDSANCAKVTRDGSDSDQWYKFRINLAAGSLAYIYQDCINTGGSADKVSGIAEMVVDTTNANGNLRNCNLRIRNSDQSTIIDSFAGKSPTDSENTWPSGVFELSPTIPKLTIDAKASALRFSIMIESIGTGYIDLYVRFVKVNVGSRQIF